MKFSLIKNDKSTAKDELLLFLIILVFAAVGITLIVTAPSFWFITSEFSKTFGVLWVVAAVMFVPGLIYRLMTNDK